MCVSPAHKKKKKRKKAEVWLWIVIALVFVNAACLHCKQQHLVLLLRLSQLTAGDLFPLPCRVRGGGMAQGDYWAGRSGRSARVSAFPLQLLILCACVCVCVGLTSPGYGPLVCPSPLRVALLLAVVPMNDREDDAFDLHYNPTAVSILSRRAAAGGLIHLYIVSNDLQLFLIISCSG